MADASLTAGVKALTMTTKRPNLPLPRELRDNIYGYLLHGDAVVSMPLCHERKNLGREEYKNDPRVASAAHTYSFHTEVVLVNKTFYAEAKEELYPYNRFVVFSYQWPDLSTILHIHNVPILTEKPKLVGRSDEHSMRLHLRHKDCAKVKAKGTPVPVQSLLMLLSDMPRFSQAIRWTGLEFSCAGNFILYITEDDKNRFDRIIFPGAQGNFHLTERFRSTTYQPLTAKAELNMTLDIHKLRIAGMTVTQNALLGEYTISASNIRFLQIAAGPSHIFVTALAWDMIDMAQSMIRRAHDRALWHDFERATALYRSIFDSKHTNVIAQLGEALHESDAQETALLLFRVLLDAVACFGLLMLRASRITAAHLAVELAGHYHDLINSFHDAGDTLGFAEARPRTWLIASPSCHFTWLCHLVTANRVTDEMIRQLECMSYLREDSMHVLHDLKLVRRWRGRTLTSKDQDEILKTSSVMAITPATDEFEIPVHIIRPKFRGWTVKDQDLAYRQTEDYKLGLKS